MQFYYALGNNKQIFEKIDNIMNYKWKEVKVNLQLYSFSVGIVASSYSIIPAIINLINLFQGNDIPRRFGNLLFNDYKKLFLNVLQF